MANRQPKVSPRAWTATTQAQRDAGSSLLDHLLQLYATCRLTAKDFCLLCHYAAEANVPGGAFSLYGVRPGQTTDGNYQKHLDVVLPKSDAMFIDVPTPVVDARYGRHQRSYPVRLTWDSLQAELSHDPAMARSLRPDAPVGPDSIMNVPAYAQHPKVVDMSMREMARPVPIALYLDGVAYQSQAAGRNDSVLGLWTINLLSGRRHFMAAIKNRDYCTCGCRGICSLYPLFHHIRWQYLALHDGIRPTERSDGRPLPDQFRPGEAMSFSAVVVYIKGDWGEHAHSLGLAGWSTKWSPCQFCSATSEERH
eukprot:3236308-Pyramimonas_sp.AAC.1